jgi:molecular chaperone Hsp33
MIIPEELNPHLLGLKEIEYYCPCNEDVVKSVIAGLPQEEIDSIFKENRYLEVSCQFCGKVYRYTREEVEKIKQEAQKGDKKEN